jgi:hypothetical protein
LGVLKLATTFLKNVQDGHDPGLVGMSWRKVTTILKDVLLSAAAKSNFVKQVS